MKSLIPLLLVAFLFLGDASEGRGEKTLEAPPVDLVRLEATIKRHFAATTGYQEGDLITRSQIEEVQTYLRKSLGHSVATHPRLLIRFLADEARLARIFYWKDGAEMLRTTVANGHSYEILDKLTFKKKSYDQFTRVVELQNLDELKQMIDEELKHQAALEVERQDRPKRRYKPPRIYTVEGYLEYIKEVYKKPVGNTAEETR